MTLNTIPNFEKSALITIDVQNDVLDDQPFGIKGTYEVIPKIGKIVNAYRNKGKIVIHIVRIYKKDGSNVDLCRRDAFLKGNCVFVAGENGSRIVHDLLPVNECNLNYSLLLSGGIQKIGEKEIIIYKSRWGAFYKTPLEKYLREKGINTLIITGCNFPNCPRTTIYEASERDFNIIIAEDAISGIYGLGVDELKNIGVRVLTSDKIIERL